MAHKTLTLQSSQIREPIDAFQVRREVKEIKDALADLPVIIANEDPEGVVPAKIGSLLLQNDTGKLWRKETGDGTNDGWVDTSSLSGLTEVQSYIDSRAPKLSTGETYNLEMNVSGSTLTISGDGGLALSAANIGYAAIRDTSGKRFLATFTANVTVTFGASSDTDGNTFGITATANWANQMPLFLGIIYKSTTEYQFCFGRVPLNVSGAAATDLCQKGDTDGDGQGDVMLLTTGLTLSQWVSLPITQVGWWKATWTTTSDNWDSFAVDHLTGFNFEYENSTWAMPSGQNGAASGKYLKDNGGTAPIFSTNNLHYNISRAAVVDFYAYMFGDGGTDGATAVDVLAALPYLAPSAPDLDFFGTAYASTPTYTQSGIFCEANRNTTSLGFARNSSATVSPSLVNSDFTAGDRELSWNVRYKLF